jgi:type I restriction enzyme M protein
MAKKIKKESDSMIRNIVVETPAQRLSGIIKTCRNIMRKDKGMNGDGDRLPMLTWIMFLKFLDDNEQLQELNSQLEGRKYKAAISSPYRWRDWAKDKNLTGDDLLSFLSNEKYKLADGNFQTGLFFYLRGLQSETGTERKDVISTVFKGVTNRMINGYLLRDIINKIDEIHFTSNEELNSLSHLYESILKEMRDASGDAGEFYTPRPVVRFMVEMLDPKIGESVLDPACGTAGFLVEAFEHLKKQAKTVEQRATLQEKSIYGGEAKPLPYLLSQMNLLLHGLNYPRIDSGNSLRFPLREISDIDRVDIVLANPPFGGEEEKGILNNFPEDRRTAETAILFIQLILRKLKRSVNGVKGGRAAIVIPNTTLFYGNITRKIREDLLTKYNLHTVIRLPKGVFEPYTDIETNLMFFDTNKPSENVYFFEIDAPEGRKQYTKTFPIKFEELYRHIETIQSKDLSTPNAWEVSKKQLLSDPNINLDLKNPNYTVKYSDNPFMETENLVKSIQTVSKVLLDLRTSIEKLKAFTSNKENWSSHLLSDFLKRNKTQINLEDNEIYKRITIRVKGRGVTLRDELEGSKIGTKKQFLVSTGQLVLSKIDARYGAFGILPEECDEAIITGNFWAYDIDKEIISPKLLKFITASKAFMDFCHNCSTGATNRKYLDEDKFLEQSFILPPTIKEQEKIADVLEKISERLSIIEKSFQIETAKVPAIMQSSLILLFGGDYSNSFDFNENELSENEDD